MPSLTHSHGDPCDRLVSVFDTDEDENDGVPERRVGGELIYFLADRIGQNRFKDEALSLVYQFPTERSRKSNGSLNVGPRPRQTHDQQIDLWFRCHFLQCGISVPGGQRQA